METLKTLAIIFSFLLAGLVAGFLLRRKTGFIRKVDRAGMPVVYAMLFIIGLSVGVKNEVVEKLGSLGMQALAICVCSIIGSIGACHVLHAVWLKHARIKK